MRKLLMILCLFVSVNSFATDFYFANSGNDANTGLIGFPWQTIAKFNSVFASKAPGDNFYFNRGDVFYGALIISRSGAVGTPITIGAYGSGPMPVITGFTSVVAWTNLGGNLWESTFAVSTLPYTNMVAVSGVNTAMGRTPNTGSYYTFQSHSGVTQITSTNLNGTPNWTGAELACNLTTGRIVRNFITAQSGSTLTCVSDPEAAGFQKDNQRFIIQNDIRTLDAQNEWYYNPAKKLDIYSTSIPSGVQIATIDSLVLLTGRNYITFDHISFQGANVSAIQVNHSHDIIIQNCDFNFCGRNAVFGSKTGNSVPITIQNCTINHINDNGIDLPRVDFDNSIVLNNTIKNCGVLYGMMDRNDGVNNNATAQGASVIGANCLVQGNTVDSCGYNGVHWFGSNTVIRNNYITDYCLLNNDGGGIYSWNGAGKTVQTGCKILNNVCLNKNTFSAVNTADYGIYLDDLTNNVLVQGNTCGNSGWGMELHNVFNIKVDSNTTFNNSMAPIILISDNGAGFVTGKTNMDSIEIKNNIFFATTATQKTFWIYAQIGTILPPHFLSDSNYFSRPIDNNGLSILTNFNDATVTDRNLAMWQTYAGQDAHSGTTPLNITNVNQLNFVYNETPSSKSVTVPASKDVKNSSYSGSISLAPYTSLISINTGALTTPTITWGPLSDITYLTPISSTQLSPTSGGVTGTYSFNHSIGEILGVGTYTFTLVFTPTDQTTYSVVSKSVTLNVVPATVTWTVTGTSKTYSGANQIPTITSSPAGVPFKILFNGLGLPVLKAGSYSYTIGSNDPNYIGNASGTFTITKALDTIIAASKTVNADGNPQTITATTIQGLGSELTATYNGGAPPSTPGVYQVIFHLTDANFTAVQDTVALTIVASAAIIFISDTTFVYDGTAHNVTVTSAYSYTLTGSPRTAAGSNAVTATINDGVHTGSASANITILKEAAVLGWSPVGNQPAGALLTSSILNATSNLPGHYVYDYPLGYKLTSNITVTGTFIPDDPSNINGGSVSQMINVYAVNQFLKFLVIGANGQILFIKQ